MSFIAICPKCGKNLQTFDFFDGNDKRKKHRCKHCKTLLKDNGIEIVSIKEKLIGKEFKVLDNGFIRLVDVMGNDSAIVQAARVSYGKGTKTKHEDEGLIRYLMRHRHTTPFEQCQLKFHVKVPMDCWRQWIRHRTASVNEYSTRYSEAIDDKQMTQINEWRTQGTINKQGSSDIMPEAVGYGLSIQEEHLHYLSNNVYKQRLEKGVAREQARKDLPLSTYTMAYWTINLHNLLHFLSLRMDSHAQLEIRSYANIIGNEIVAKLFPLTWGAFQDYRLNAMTLTARDINMLLWIRNNDWEGEALKHQLNKLFQFNEFGWFDLREDGTLKNNIERLEFEEKAERLGIEVPWK
jgi:thymidylate synthase (FAD)